MVDDDAVGSPPPHPLPVGRHADPPAAARDLQDEELAEADDGEMGAEAWQAIANPEGFKPMVTQDGTVTVVNPKKTKTHLGSRPVMSSIKVMASENTSVDVSCGSPRSISGAHLRSHTVSNQLTIVFEIP